MTEEPATYTTIEAHIGLSFLDPGLLADVLALGFEPHHFAGKQPTGYHYNFTQQFVLRRPGADDNRLRILLRRRTEEARQVVQRHPRAVGFIENEIYRSEYDTRLPARPLAPGALDDFPHEALAYREVPVPTTRSEAAASGVALDSRRAADIHIKIPGRCAPHSTRPLAERITACRRSLDPALRNLGDCLGAAGFYRQISQSGNILYTAHFAELSAANRVFHELTRFAATHGGIINVVREACTALWRKRIGPESDESALAPIPPLLSTGWGSCRASGKQPRRAGCGPG
jgi:hypothetical protein